MPIYDDLIFRFWKTICNSTKGNSPILQGSWCDPTSSIRNRKDCNFLLWNPSTAWLQCSRVSSFGSCTHSWTCSTNWKSHAGPRGLPWSQSPRVRGWDQCPWGSKDPLCWGPRGCWYTWTCLWHAQEAVTTCRLHQDVCLGWSWWNALKRFQRSGTFSNLEPLIFLKRAI